MSALSSNQQPRPRTMASDITKLFRSVASAPQRTDKDTEAPTSSVTPTDRAGSTKKKITRIPLFGRTRKKSNQSSSSSPYASTSIIRESTDVGEMSSRPPSSSEPERRPSLPTLLTPVPSSSKLSTSSFSSKFAAHFSSSQSVKSDLPLDSRASSSRTSLISAPSSSGLVPPRARPSYESGSSTASRTRSTTPRGGRPVIMVSTTDNMDEFKDLFTKELPASSKSGDLRDSDTTENSSRTPEPTIYRRGQTPASILAAAIRDQQMHERQPSASSKTSRQTTDSEKSSSNEKSDGRSTPKLSSARESPRLIQVPEEKLQSSHSRRPSTSQGCESSSVRSRMRAPSRSKPPSIPLPDIPSTSSDGHSKKPDATDPSDMDSRPAEAGRLVRRPRASTISSIPELPPAPPSAPVSQDRSESTTLDPLNAVNIEEIDIDTASPEQLRRALRSRNKKFEELTAYMLRREESWSAERKAMEKKIASLQRDLVRRESEITGLKLIINDEDVLRRPKPPPPGIINQARLSTVSTSPVQSDQEGSTHSHASGSRRLNYQSDSGAESPKSGNESSSSLFRIRKMHQRSSAIVGENYTSRKGSTMRLPKLSQEKTSSESPYSKRVSMMSMASSGSSGSSSLMPPSPSITMSSLSAIPEGGGLVENTPDSEDRRAVRASRRISGSSMTSTSTAASSAYSTNIKRSRPPSIAQVLEKSPNIDDVLEKLRPFA